MRGLHALVGQYHMWYLPHEHRMVVRIKNLQQNKIMIARPSYHPVFGHLQYTEKRRGKAWPILSHE